MAAGVPARLTAAQGRRFGVTVGGAFLLLAAVAWWRDARTASTMLGTLGGVLAVAGLVIPTMLGPVERAWMKLAHVISKFTTPIVMGVLYLVVLLPVGLVRRTLGGNPMAHEPVGGSYWKVRPAGSRVSDLRRQF